MSKTQLISTKTFQFSQIGVCLRVSSANVAMLFAATGESLAVPVLFESNDHYYELVEFDTPHNWFEALDDAASRTFVDADGRRYAGYSGTITSAEEQEFIEGLLPPFSGFRERVWLGGMQADGSIEPDQGWEWITGEPWEYTHWNDIEPNNELSDENALDLLIGTGFERWGFWNDERKSGFYFVPVRYSLVEFEPIGPHARLFYNNSALDGNGSVVDANDFPAIAPDKMPLRLGQTATMDNVSGYSRGINGLFIDIDNLPDDGAGVDTKDFVIATGNDDLPNAWRLIQPADVGVMPGMGESGFDRVYLTFPDGLINNTWLRVSVQANDDTGLVASEDFFFGAASGETGAGFVSGVVGVDAADLQSIASDLTPLGEVGTVAVANPNDVNRDGAVDVFDLQSVAMNLRSQSVNLITPQLPAGASTAVIPEPSSWALVITTFLAASFLLRGLSFSAVVVENRSATRGANVLHMCGRSSVNLTAAARGL